MGIVVGTNSWVTLAEADIYFIDKFNASTWATLSNTNRIQLLISAYRWIKQQNQFIISSISDLLKQAQYETAWYLYKHGDQHDKHQALNAQGVKSFSVSQFSEDIGDVQFPKYIEDMLSDYIEKGNAVIINLHRDLK
jgi:predicted P-loop ATPase/GTPase